MPHLPSRQIALLVCALLLSSTQLAQARVAGFVGRQGTQIVNDNGVLLLKGVNLGNWLFNESYMTGAPFDHYAWSAALKDVLGTDANVAAFYAAWRANYTTLPDIQRIKALGFNSVRVPLDYALFLDTTTGQIRNDNWVWIDNLLTWCASAGVYVILDMHGSPAQVAGHLPLFFDSDKKGKLALVWWAIANRYKDNVWLAGYDLLNEPVIDNQSDKWRLRDFYVYLTNSIRSIDTNHLIFAEGNYYGSDLWDLDPRWDENMAFSIHNYWTQVPNPQLATQVQLANDSNVPLWLGETGENSNTWINAQVRSVEGYGVGWATWPYKFPSERLNSITWVARTAGYQAVLDYWNGAGAKPSQTAANAALLDMAQRTARANCTDNMDVVDALLRADFHTASAPFAQNVAPGRIYASDYDMGAQGIAANDSVYQTTAQGTGYTNWNNGFLNRNDGVDLGFLYDNGNRYYVGWTDAGEWLRYTFVSGGGQPVLSVHYASAASQQVHIEIDGANITGAVTLPASGGFGTFTTATVPNTATLAAGLHTMRVVFDSGGVNLYWLEFAGLSSALPAPWSDADIGGPRRVGDAFFAAGTWTVAGGGADIFGASDQFHFAAQDFIGDGTLVARVASLQMTDGFAKTGIMWRESNATDAPYAFAFVGPNTLGYEVRTATGSAAAGASYGPGSAPKWLKLTRLGNVFTAFASDDGAAWTQLGTPQTIAMAATARAGLAVTAHDDADLNTSTFTNVSLLLPPPWTNQDIGSVGSAGSAGYSAGVFTLNGSGADIWSSADAFHFFYQPLTGDGVIVARVTGLANTDPWAKAGVMIRDGTSAGARNAMLAITPGNGTTIQWRDTANGASTAWGTNTDTAPRWLRLARSGNIFTAWKSNDGATWTTVHSVTLALPATLQFGLAVTSHNNSALNAASFDSVSVTPLPPGTSSWGAFQNAWFTVAQLADSNVSGLLADANGDGLKNLLAYATGISPWIQATAANGGLPTAQIQNGYLTLTYTRLRTRLDIAYAVEVTGNLTTWNSGSVFSTDLSVTPIDATREQVVARDNTPISGASRRALRLRITQTTP